MLEITDHEEERFVLAEAFRGAGLLGLLPWMSSTFVVACVEEEQNHLPPDWKPKKARRGQGPNVPFKSMAPAT